MGAPGPLSRDPQQDLWAKSTLFGTRIVVDNPILELFFAVGTR